MAINFPVNPNTGDLYSFGERNWEYTGQGWKLLSQISLANSAFIKANSSFIQANAAFNTANAAFLAANNATDTYVRNHANSAFDQANAAFNKANSNSFGVIYASNNSTYINATSSNSQVTFIGLNGIKVEGNTVSNQIVISTIPGIQGIVVDYGFVSDSLITDSYDYGTL